MSGVWTEHRSCGVVDAFFFLPLTIAATPKPIFHCSSIYPSSSSPISPFDQLKLMPKPKYFSKGLELTAYTWRNDKVDIGYLTSRALSSLKDPSFVIIMSRVDTLSIDEA
jgi:hypothetical protein